MTTIPLSTLPTPVRNRLRALALEWFGGDPWGTTALFGSTGCPWWQGEPRTACLPLHIGAGFDLGVRLVAQSRRVPYQVVCIEVDSEPERLAALVRGLT